MNKKIWFEKLISGFIVLLMISLFISATFTVVAQEMMKVSGIITDNKTNETIPGVTVVVKDTQTGSVTDLNGKYSINAPAGNTLAISCIGYESIEVKIGSQSEVNIKLAVSIHSIDEVVAIGYGKSTKKEITGAITTVKSEDFNKGAYNNPMGLLQGKVAGLTITNPNGADPQAGYNILLRGTNTLTSGTGPLIVIDGVPGGDLKNISPDEVESMDVIGLHELYKQRSVSETWIEQVKGHVMAGSTLTDNFWANDILWQLNVLAYNLSVMMRQKKSKFKKQEHRTFIDWFIAVPAMITSSGHQIELRMYEHHFYKADWEELDRLIEAA